VSKWFNSYIPINQFRRWFSAANNLPTFVSWSTLQGPNLQIGTAHTPQTPDWLSGLPHGVDWHPKCFSNWKTINGHSSVSKCFNSYLPINQFGGWFSTADLCWFGHRKWLVTNLWVLAPSPRWGFFLVLKIISKTENGKIYVVLETFLLGIKYHCNIKYSSVLLTCNF